MKCICAKYWYILSLKDSEQSRFCRLDFVLMPKAYNCWYAFVPYLIIAGSQQHNNITIKSILFFVDCKKNDFSFITSCYLPEIAIDSFPSTFEVTVDK